MWYSGFVKNVSAHPVGWITLDETLGVLATLGGPEASITDNQLRYWDRQAIVPVRRAQQGTALMYSTQDVALVRVIARLLAASVPPQQVTAALRYLRASICDAFRDKATRRAFYIDDRGIGHVVRVSEVPADNRQSVDLRACWDGVSRVMRAELQRRRHSTVWNGVRHVKAKALVAA